MDEAQQKIPVYHLDQSGAYIRGADGNLQFSTFNWSELGFQQRPVENVGMQPIEGFPNQFGIVHPITAVPCATETTPVADNSKESASVSDSAAGSDHSPHSEDSQFRWSSAAVKALISTVEKHYDQLKSSSTIKKKVWKEISDEMRAIDYEVTDQQCWTKWKALKVKYKQVEKCNKKSGNGRKIWEHFEAIHSFMMNQPDVNPVATCSSHASTCATHADAETASKKRKFEEQEQEQASPEEKKKKLTAAEQRHQENLQRKDKFLALFEKLVDKL